MNKLRGRGIEIVLNARVVNIENGLLKYKLKSNDNNENMEHEVNFGVCVWAAGTKQRSITKTISSLMGSKQNEIFNKNGGRLAVDNFHRVIDDDEKTTGTLFSIGDCSSNIEDSSPQTAQVAAQQGAFLARLFNREYDLSASTPIITKEMRTKNPLKFTYLSIRNINHARPFKFINLGSLAYIGGSEAVAKVQLGDSGIGLTSSGDKAFILWYHHYHNY